MRARRHQANGGLGEVLAGNGRLGGERAEERDQHGQDPRGRVVELRHHRRRGRPVLLQGRHHRLHCGRRHVRQGDVDRLGVRDQRGGHGLDRVVRARLRAREDALHAAGPAGGQHLTDSRLQEDRRPRQHRVLRHQDQPGRQLRGHRRVRRAHLQVRPQDVGLRRDLLAGQRASDSGARQRRQQRPASGRGGRRLRHRDQAGRLVLRARRRVPRREHIHRRRLVRRAYPQGRRDHVLHDDHRSPQRLGRRRSLCHPPEQGVPPHGLRREDPAG